MRERMYSKLSEEKNLKENDDFFLFSNNWSRKNMLNVLNGFNEKNSRIKSYDTIKLFWLKWMSL